MKTAKPEIISGLSPGITMGKYWEIVRKKERTDWVMKECMWSVLIFMGNEKKPIL